MVGTVDLDRDGRNEIVTGPAIGSPLIRLWTGTTFTLFGEYLAYDPALGDNGVFVGSASANPSTDDAPRVASTVPANAATGVLVDADLTVTFSEAVTAGAGAFVLECPAGTPIALTNVTASPATTFTLHPTSPLPLRTACTLRIVAKPDHRRRHRRSAGHDDRGRDRVLHHVGVRADHRQPDDSAGRQRQPRLRTSTFTQTGGTAPITWSVSAGRCRWA